MAEGGRFASSEARSESRFFVFFVQQKMAEGGRFELPLQITPD